MLTFGLKKIRQCLVGLLLAVAVSVSPPIMAFGHASVCTETTVGHGHSSQDPAAGNVELVLKNSPANGHAHAADLADVGSAGEHDHSGQSGTSLSDIECAGTTCHVFVVYSAALDGSSPSDRIDIVYPHQETTSLNPAALPKPPRV